jgi:glycosyltransferase involved in cell wall biosynthesis
MRASVATVLPSEQEGLPRCIMESLSLEVPAIGSDIRGVRDLVEGGCGILYPVGDVAALAGAMEWIIGQPDEAQVMCRKGRQKMQGPYALRNTVKAWMALYAEMMER